MLHQTLSPILYNCPGRRSNRRQTTSQVAPLAASQASSDIQDGDTDVQTDVLVMQAYLNDLIQSCSSSSFAVIRRPAAERPKNANWDRASVFYRSRLRTLGTHYHRTLDPAVLSTPSNDTWKPICSVLTWCHRCLCIYGLSGAIQMLLSSSFYYFFIQIILILAILEMNVT